MCTSALHHLPNPYTGLKHLKSNVKKAICVIDMPANSYKNSKQAKRKRSPLDECCDLFAYF